MEPTQHGYRHPVKGTGAHRPTKGNGKAYRWLMEHVSHQGDACLIWPFGRDRRVNRGSLGYKGTRYWAHRLMCEMAHGAPPTPKHQAAHSCGKGHYCCVNPRHLEWKTNTQNQLDRAVNGNALRNPHGPGGALSDEQKAGIMALKGKMPQTKIAAKFGVSLGCVQYWFKYREARGHHVQKMKVWSADETKRLHIAIERGLTLAEMASFIGRPKAAIAAKRTRLRHSCRCQWRRKERMGEIPTERAWIRICLGLGFRPRDVKGLRRIYRHTHPQQIAEFDYSAGPPFAVRYGGYIIPKRRFKTPEAAEEWGLENYKGRFEGWDVISLAAAPVTNGDRS